MEIELKIMSLRQAQTDNLTINCLLYNFKHEK